MGLDNKLDFQGQACTASPNSVGYPYKILFIVDVSGSTVNSDPTNNRGPAVQSVIQQYINNPEVSFAIISFDTQPNILEPNFTRDLNLLLPVVPELNRNLNSTNYLDTLRAAQQIIANDANTVSATERARTRYDIEWLSDGVPNPCVDTNTILDTEQQILNLVKTQGLFSIKLSTVFLTGAFVGGCPNTPDQIMPPMATLGNGTYQALSGPNLHFNIDFQEILQPFSKQLFYVVNESRVVKNDQMYPDSDADGVSDADEAAQGTDPTKPDTKNDGCSDRVTQLTAVNPGLCPAICAQAMSGGDVSALGDTDADTLRDCEESALGIIKEKADSDGDNLIDPLEIRFGTNANAGDTWTTDTDGDVATDGNEILAGTDPLTAQSNQDLAYKYSPLTGVPSTKTGEQCFAFNVSNVQLVETMATATSKAGDNRICVYLEQLPTESAAPNAEPTVARACYIANYQVVEGHALKIPENGVVSLNPNDFKPYICGSAKCPGVP